MAGRRLDADERALWARVTATIRPISDSPRPVLQPPTPAPPAASVAAPKPVPVRAGVRALPPPKPGVARPAAGVGETLDGGWDRRLRQGAVAPDLMVDLHGHTLASAHAELDRSLQWAVTTGARVMLLITGKPRPRAQDVEGGMRRGAIRASVGDWLSASRHARSIAAVRPAHPRHGGAGALYVILRRTK